MNLPLQREPIQRWLPSQSAGDADSAAAMLASGVNPSDQGIQPDGWEDILGSIAKVALPALTSLI